MFKNLKEFSGLISTFITGSTQTVGNLTSAMTYGSSALNALAKDAEDAAIKSSELNCIDRLHKYNLRKAEIKQIEANIVNPDEFEKKVKSKAA